MSTKLSPAERFLKTYYPVPAINFDGVAKTKQNWIAALKHSIRKWEGLLAVKRGKFGKALEIGDYCDIVDTNGTVLGVSERTCALCNMSGLWCTDCILKRKCNILTKAGKSPWDIWIECKNPRPMLYMLKRELKKLQAKKVR